MNTLENKLLNYLNNQSSPVPLEEIQKNSAFSGLERRELSTALRSLVSQGKAYKSLQSGKSCYSTDSEQGEGPNNSQKIINNLTLALRGIASNTNTDAGEELDFLSDVPIVKDHMCSWTFNDGIRKTCDGWSVSIPDNFVEKSSDEGRPFVAVPCETQENTDDYQPIIILPGTQTETDYISKYKKYLFHPYAREALAETYGRVMAEQTTALLGQPVELLSVALDFGAAWILIQNTGNNSPDAPLSFSYLCHIANHKNLQTLRVQTGTITQKQKDTLTQSIIEWIKTFKYDNEKSEIPKKEPLEKSTIITNLCKGDIDLFNEAIDIAIGAYNVIYQAKINTLQYHITNGLFDGDTQAAVKTILSKAIEIRAIHYEKTDILIDKLLEKKPNPDFLKKVYNKACELGNFQTSIEVDGKKVRISTPDSIIAIQEKWKKGKQDVNKLKQEEENEKKKRKEKQNALIHELSAAIEKEKALATKIEKAKKELQTLTKERENLVKFKTQWLALDEECNKIEKRLEEINTEILTLNEEKSRLGFFSIKRKKEISHRLNDLEQHKILLEKEKETKSAKKNGYTSASEIDKEIQKIDKNIKKQSEISEEVISGRSSDEIRREMSENNFPEPSKTQLEKAKENKKTPVKSNGSTKTDKKTEISQPPTPPSKTLEEEILEVFKRSYGASYTISEIQALTPKVPRRSDVEDIINKLCANGVVEIEDCYGTQTRYKLNPNPGSTIQSSTLGTISVNLDTGAVTYTSSSAAQNSSSLSKEEQQVYDWIKSRYGSPCTELVIWSGNTNMSLSQLKDVLNKLYAKGLIKKGLDYSNRETYFA